MMKGTPGGIPVMFGGEIAYLYLAITDGLPNEVWFQGKIPPASPKTKVYRNLFRSPQIEILLPDQPVLSELPAFRRGDVFRTRNKRLATRSRGQCRSGGGEEPYALAH